MRALLIAAALGLAGCTGFAPPTSPGQVASQSVIDERLAISAELAYKSWRLGVETAINAGLIKADKAQNLIDIDNKAYAAVLKVRRAYNAANAADFNSGIAEILALVAEGNAILGSR